MCYLSLCYEEPHCKSSLQLYGDKFDSSDGFETEDVWTFVK